MAANNPIPGQTLLQTFAPPTPGGPPGGRWCWPVRVRPAEGCALLQIIAVSPTPRSSPMWRDLDDGHPLPFPFVPGSLVLGRFLGGKAEEPWHMRTQGLVIIDPFANGFHENAEYRKDMLGSNFQRADERAFRGENQPLDYAKYAIMSVDLCHPMAFIRLLTSATDNGLGYQMEDLNHMLSLAMPLAGLDKARLKDGETVLISLTNKRFGRPAIHVALAMGARVIAFGRDTTMLEELSWIPEDLSINPSRLKLVQITDNVDRDTEALEEAAGPNGVNVFWDMSFPEDLDSTHYRSCINALNYCGRMSLMGCFTGEPDADQPHLDYSEQIQAKRARVTKTYMPTGDQISKLITMVEMGILPLGPEAGMPRVKSCRVGEWESMLYMKPESTEDREIVVIE